jgi:leucyl-tRNA synthetase
MEYVPGIIEKKWQSYWRDNQTYAASDDRALPKYYVLDMFPYPSGAGLHVGHPLGYIASDCVARFKRHQGYNVLHPMGYDAFGLPAEQYAIQTGQHPSITTETNIARYRQQLDRIGFSFDWSREVRTCEPDYYRWTQWIFAQFFGSWYNRAADRAEPIESLVAHLSAHGTIGLNAAQTEAQELTAAEWNAKNGAAREALLQNYRLAYRSESWVNWCPALGTVLANDEIKDGYSERGGHPVVQKQMMQWSMRISAYAQRLLDDLDPLDWSDSIKESQRHWIGRSEGAWVHFDLAQPVPDRTQLTVFTTRPDTLFGATYLAVAPELEGLEGLVTAEQADAVAAVREAAGRKTERDRMADVKTINGAFTGSYALHPLTGAPLPIWVADYVLAGYGTGAVMAVPAHDSRDHRFAKHFGLPIVEVIAGGNVEVEAFESYEGIAVNSDFLNGRSVSEAKSACIAELAARGKGEQRIQFRLRDAIFGRQRYWGEPIPVSYADGVPQVLPEDALPLVLPEVDKYLPTESGEPPLARAAHWADAAGNELETTTMPGWAGSSWYFLRYMDPHNRSEFVGQDAAKYWGQVDLYVGGSEHATGHLLYARFWNQFLFDRGWVGHREPFKKLVNQGMIQGVSALLHRLPGTNTFVSAGSVGKRTTSRIHVDVSLINEKNELDQVAFRAWLPEFAHAEFETENGAVVVEREVEKMSKSKHNVVNPDAVADQVGADGLRLYEMFLGPLEQSKPWDTQGIAGVSNFLRKTWRLFTAQPLSEEPAPLEALKIAHKLVHKVASDMENLSFNTSVSALMIAVNELSALPTRHREPLEMLAIAVSPLAPHLAEELWAHLGHAPSVTRAPWPQVDPALLMDDSVVYPVQFNGKTRFSVEVPRSATSAEVEALVRSHEQTLKYVGEQSIRKVIVVPGRIVNLVVV